MSESNWKELPPYSYERYKAWMFERGATVYWDEHEWLDVAEPLKWPTSAIRAQVIPQIHLDIINRSKGIVEPSDKPIPTNSEIRAELLDTVKSYVCKDRSTAHGDAEDNFKHIAWLWNDYLAMIKPREKLTNKDVAAMMVLFKVARAAHNPDNLDNWLDAAGYSICGGGIAKVEQIRNEGNK